MERNDFISGDAYYRYKFERESKLVLSKSAIDAICALASRDEVIAVSKSRIVEVIKKEDQ